MKKIIFCSTLLLGTQAFANINCNQQYGGEYNCYNYETGQMQTIEINQYPTNDVQPVQMPDLSSLPDPTDMMYMDSDQVNDMFNPQPIAPMTIQPSSSANMALQNAQQTQMQINAQAAQAQANLAYQEQVLAEQRKRSYEETIRLVREDAKRRADIEAQARQQSAQLNTQNNSHSNYAANHNQSSNMESDSNASNVKNFIIGILMLVIAVMIGVFLQKK